jgi:ferredoxin
MPSRFIFSRYHSKVVSRGDVQKILTLDHDLRIISDENTKIIQFAHSNKIIFEEPEFIVIMDCPCKLQRKDPCHPINACMAVGKQLALHWLENCKTYNPKKITQAEAIEHIKALRETGHFQQVFAKKSIGGQTYCICSCCKKCCVSLEAGKLTRKIDKNLSQNAPSGYAVRHNESKCIKCGKCADICSFDNIVIEDGERLYNKNKCMGCELCVDHCPNGALELYFDPGKNILPLDIDLAAEMSYAASKRQMPILDECATLDFSETKNSIERGSIV